MNRILTSILTAFLLCLFSNPEAHAQERQRIVLDKAESWLKEREVNLPGVENEQSDTKLTSDDIEVSTTNDAESVEEQRTLATYDLEDPAAQAELNRRGKQKKLRQLYKLRYPDRFWPQNLLTFRCGKLLPPRFKVSAHKVEVRFAWQF